MMYTSDMDDGGGMDSSDMMIVMGRLHIRFDTVGSYYSILERMCRAVHILSKMGSGSLQQISGIETVVMYNIKHSSQWKEVKV
jgi:hypothetical protein